ncbi:MAG: hypothetical protein ABJB76_05140 [Candidatus Nitrosocosmicus sp.]
MPQINYFFKNPDYYYEYENDDVSLDLKHPETGKNLTFFEVLTCNMVYDLFVDRTMGAFKIIAVTKDGPSLYLLADNRRVIQLKLKSRIDNLVVE